MLIKNTIPERFKLTEHDKQSAVWLKLAEEINQRIAICRLQNDGNLDQFETSKLRGRIAELKSLLALAESGPTQVMIDDE